MGLFDVDAESYARFMGRFSEPLADAVSARLGLATGWRVLDVGCGPGALTSRLVDRLGPSSVAAVDPSATFVDAVRRRLPGVDVRASSAEQLPFADGSFDVSLAQLVVHFMGDPVAGLGEMARVTRTGGLVAASVWDHAGGRGPLSPFWDAVAAVGPPNVDESGSPGSRAGRLAELFEAAGLTGLVTTEETVRVEFASFEDWWEPYTLGVGPAGAYLRGCGATARSRLQEAARRLLPRAPFELAATAWCATGTAA